MFEQHREGTTAERVERPVRLMNSNEKQFFFYRTASERAEASTRHRGCGRASPVRPSTPISSMRARATSSCRSITLWVPPRMFSYGKTQALHRQSTSRRSDAHAQYKLSTVVNFSYLFSDGTERQVFPVELISSPFEVALVPYPSTIDRYRQRAT